jgi:hypothetical protein
VQSEPTGFNAWQLYTWNLSPPTLLPHHPGALWGHSRQQPLQVSRRLGACAGAHDSTHMVGAQYTGSSPSRGGLKECWEPVGAV